MYQNVNRNSVFWEIAAGIKIHFRGNESRNETQRGNLTRRKHIHREYNPLDRCVCTAFRQDLWVVTLNGEYEDFDIVISFSQKKN